ncbi:flavin-containing monooxygenase [Streptomyces albus]|uniref:flavin-containing monooxygenase n=1 Tax=Streptomyces albus TaxID=1888 RepID=UPI003453ECE0
MSMPSAVPDSAGPDSGAPVHVIGAGPGGLAVAAALRARGVGALVLERSDAVGTSWRHHYERLHLHTTRAGSALPGLRIPRRYGRWVARADLVRYLEQYAAHHRLRVATGVEVRRLERTADRQWVLHTAGGRRLAGPAVVVATGCNHTPYLPDWPGRDGFRGTLLHAARYRDAAPFRGKDVLVAGAGNTGAEIAVDLVEGGAARVRLAVRTPPHILRRSTLGWPSQRSAVLCRRLPVPLVDRMAARVSRLSVPDLTPYGLPRPEAGLYTRVRQGALPVLDVGIVEAVRRGAVQPVAAVSAFEGEKVVLADGTTLAPDAVIAATGYRRGLEGLVGHLGVLDADGRPLVHGPDTHPAAPALHFLGYSNPISGTLRELRLDARRIARRLARATH